MSSRSVSRAIVRSSRSSSPLPSFWSSVSRAIVFFSRFLPFLSDDDKDHDDITKVRRLLSMSAELSSALLALPPLFPPSGRLSAELSSSFLVFSPFSPTTTRTTTTSLRFGVFSVCLPSYCLLFSLSLPSSLLLVVCLPSYRLLFSFSPLSLHDDKDHDDIRFAPAGACLCNSAVHATNLAPFADMHFFISLHVRCRGPGTHIHLSWPTKTR